MPLIEISPELDLVASAPIRVSLPPGAGLPAGALQLREEGGNLVAPAQRDGEELVVKKVNDFSEHYDIFAGEGYIRRGPGAYRSSCFPAAF